MRTIITLAFLVIGASGAAVVLIRSATRIAVVRAMSKDGRLLICGDLSSVTAPWLSPDVHLYSTAPDGDLAIHRISATTKVGTPSRGSQSTSASNATTVALGSDAVRFEIDAGLDSADSGNTSVGYASENGTAIALPIRRFLFGAESNRLHVSVDPSAPGLFAPDLLSRGLYVAGEGWKRIDDESVDLFCGPGVSEGIGSQVNRYLADALRRLAAAGFPPPSRKPAVIVVDETREGAFARFDLQPESEVYVVQCRGGLLLESGVFRDLAADGDVALHDALRTADRLRDAAEKIVADVDRRDLVAVRARLRELVHVLHGTSRRSTTT